MNIQRSVDIFLEINLNYFSPFLTTQLFYNPFEYELQNDDVPTSCRPIGLISFIFLKYVTRLHTQKRT